MEKSFYTASAINQFSIFFKIRTNIKFDLKILLLMGTSYGMGVT